MSLAMHITEPFISRFDSSEEREAATLVATLLGKYGLQFDPQSLSYNGGSVATDGEVETLRAMRDKLGMFRYRDICRDVEGLFVELSTPAGFDLLAPDFGIEGRQFDPGVPADTDDTGACVDYAADARAISEADLAVWADPFADVTDEEEAAIIEAGKADATAETDIYGQPLPEYVTEAEAEAYRQWQRGELQAGDEYQREVNRTWREDFRASGYDVRDYILQHNPNASPESDEAFAAKLGYHQTTWDDQHNVTRRENARKAAGNRAGLSAKMGKLQAAKSEAPDAPAETQEPAKSAGPVVRDISASIGRVSAAYDAAIIQRPDRAAKLLASLKFQLSEFDNAIAHHTGKGKTWEQAAELWERAALAACAAKLR